MFYLKNINKMCGCLCANEGSVKEIDNQNSKNGNGSNQTKDQEEIEFKQEKYIQKIQLEEKNGIKIINKEIELEIIHVNIIDSTMPASRAYIDQGIKLPFIYNADIQTAGRGKGERKWSGDILGNLYTSTCIPISMIRNELNDNDILVKITAISIYEQIVKYVNNEFFLKYPNDIICKDNKKLGGILVQPYKDFIIIGFGINIINKPEQVRKGGLQPCFIKEHLPEGIKAPNPVDLSIEVTKNIFLNLNLTSDEVSKLFDKYININNS